MTVLTCKVRAWLTSPSDIARLGSDNPPKPYFSDADMTDSGWIDLGYMDVPVIVPEVQGLIDQAERSLREAIQKVRADAYVKTNALETMISNLLALEYTPTTPDVSKPDIPEDVTFHSSDLDDFQSGKIPF